MEENNIICCGSSIEDIEFKEQLLETKLPNVYKEFLMICGVSSEHLFCGCKVGLSDIDFINESGRAEYEKALGVDCPKNIFFIMEHHGYSFYYFSLTEGDNPDIWLLVHGDEITHEPIGKFKDVLNKEIERLLG